ncbi:LysR family transcriptional regulator [Eubacteriaceae bacterium ES3]|nr:LysR family transcriptional regulator [Eubacteriaceae bacterium ES3]
MINQRHLEYFLKVYQYKSISKAAEALHISPQGISKTILSLEEEVGEVLFDRKGKSLTPTPAATVLKHHAQKILDEYELIQSRQFLSPSRKIPLKILTSCDVLSYLTVAFIEDFQKAHPDILPIFNETTDKIAQQILQDEEVEIAILPGPLDPEIFSTEYIFSCHYCFVINTSHYLSQKSSIRLEDLHKEPLAIRGREYSLYGIHQNLLSERGIVPIQTIEASNYSIIHHMAEANLCIGSSLDYIAFSDPRPNTVILPFDGETMMKTFYVVQKNKKTPGAEAQKFRRFLLDWLNEHKDQLFRWP